MRYLLIVLGLFVSFFGNAQSQGVTNAQTKLRPNQLRWSPTDATLNSVYIIRADTATGEPGWYLVTLGGSGVADTTLAGDVVGGLNSTFVRKINGVTVENKTPQGREVLTYNGTQWTPDSIDLEDLPQMNASRLLGRGSTTSGAPEQLTTGTGLRISTNILETYMTGGTGITLSGASPMTITNSLPDQTVSITGGGINSVTGTYPNFTVTGTEIDGSTTNEIQTIDTLTVASSLLRLKLSGSAVKTLAMSNFATSPAGSSMQVQYNNAGSFGALDSFTVFANPDRVGIGVPTPTARLDIQGSGATSATNALRIRNSAGTELMSVRNDGYIGLGTNSPVTKLTNYGTLLSDGIYNASTNGLQWRIAEDDKYAVVIQNNSSYGNALLLKGVDAKENNIIFAIKNGDNTRVFDVTGTGNTYSKGTLYSGGQFTMGTDMSIIPIAGAESCVQAYHGLLLVGKRGGNYGAAISTIGNASNVAIPSQSASSFGLLIRGATAQTADLLRLQDISSTTLMNITSAGSLGLNITTPLAGLHNAIATTASTPSMLLSGTGFSGGTATTTKPTLLIEPTGTTSTGWSTSGTKLGVNAESGFTGRYLDLQLAGVSKFNVQGDKINMSTSKTPSSASDTGTTGDICWDSNYIYVCVATNTWKRTAITTW